MKVTVTQHCIDSGIRHSPYGCPIAYALSYKGCTNVAVGPEGEARLVRNGIPRYYSLPPIAREFIQGFDRGRKVEPITFEIKVRKK